MSAIACCGVIGVSGIAATPSAESGASGPKQRIAFRSIAASNAG